MRVCFHTLSIILLANNNESVPYSFGGQNIRGSAILRHFVGNIFVVAACTAGKGSFIRG